MSKKEKLKQKKKNNLMVGIMNTPLDPMSNFLLKQNPKLDIDSTLKANMAKNFVKRMFDSKPMSIPDPQDSKKSMTHFMEVSDGMAYPRVVQMGNQLKYLSSDDAYNFAKKTGEFIKFKDDNDALYFTQNYKKGKNVTIGK